MFDWLFLSIYLLFTVPGPSEAKERRASSTAKSKSTSKSAPSKWTEEGVQEWLKKMKLKDVCDTLEGLDGSHLKEMYHNMIRNPDKFQHEMKSGYQMSSKTCLKFTVALKNIF